MSVIPLYIDGDNPTVVEDVNQFDYDGHAVRIVGLDREQFRDDSDHCNVSYDLRVGTEYRDHRNEGGTKLSSKDKIRLLPGMAVIIKTEEAVHLPKGVFGQIVPKISMLQKGFANTPSKIDPGYGGHLLITAFNHGKRTLSLRPGDSFCSLYLLEVNDGIRPYNKKPKEIEGMAPTNQWQRVRDFLEANNGVFIALLTIATVISIAISILSLLVRS